MNIYSQASIFLLALLFVSFTTANEQQAILQQTELAIKAGDAKSLITNFDNVIDIKTDNKEGAYSKTQAEFVLKDFFRRFPPKSFDYKHQGSSPAGAHYAIGTYISGGTSFRVYMKLRKVGNSFLMDTLSFSKN